MTKADKAYDMTDENIEKDLIQEKNLSTFRRKRLAEKKYAFTEEDNELTPFRKQNNRYLFFKTRQIVVISQDFAFIFQ